ncbi:MAG: hypothetical protein R3240_04580 [Gammaproteobacteria bacterium]|nr:hypothetical protein [Gammaproteobacteria bacterium]
MKRTGFAIGLILSGCLALVSRAEAGEQYWMADVGLLWNLDNTYEPDMMQLFSITYGYGFNASWAAEIDYKQTFGGGKFSRSVSTNNTGFTSSPETGKFSLWMSSASLVYRHMLNEQFYARGDLAFNYREEKRTSSQAGKGDFSVVNDFTIGGGVGMLLGNVIGSSLTVEADFTYYNSDLMGLMIGANATF